MSKHDRRCHGVDWNGRNQQAATVPAAILVPGPGVPQPPRMRNYWLRVKAIIRPNGRPLRRSYGGGRKSWRMPLEPVV
jgi:hypothetical protein